MSCIKHPSVAPLGETTALGIALPFSVQIGGVVTLCDALLGSLPEITAVYYPLLSLGKRKGCECREKSALELYFCTGVVNILICYYGSEQATFLYSPGE